jgi:two-component system OmpR family sensor kinase
MRDLAESLISLAATDPEVPHETEPVDVATTIGQAVDAALAIDASRTVLISVDPAAGLVAAEPVGLRQVLDNLIGNVRTHTPAGTTTRVEARRQGREVIISVIDDGPGLGPDERDRMFDRFWRRDPSRSRQAGGSGLGLSIVAALVASWDGTVAAAESDGGGLTVSVTLHAH